jgi:hypothetical protein
MTAFRCQFLIVIDLSWASHFDNRNYLLNGDKLEHKKALDSKISCGTERGEIGTKKIDQKILLKCGLDLG